VNLAEIDDKIYSDKNHEMREKIDALYHILLQEKRIIIVEYFSEF